jgi:phosphoribosyl 1,2-cyclic phosphodiesterase
VKVTLYGVRGSIPAPLKNKEFKEKSLEILHLFSNSNFKNSGDIGSFWQTLPPRLRYTVGGDTTCVDVISSSGKNYAIDFGTGARSLGDTLVPHILGSKEQFILDVFVTHTHWDHIQAIPFFKPLYFPNATIRFHSPYPDLEERLMRQMEKEFFPISFHATSSKKEFDLFQPGDVREFEDGKLKVEVHPLKHPGNSYAYKFTERNRKFIFATDAEFTGEDLEYIRGISSFFEKADLLVLDAQYTLDESFAKFDWGHTAYTMAVNIAVQWKVKNLALTHHEPAYGDNKVFGIWEEAMEHNGNLTGSKVKIHLAREGMSFKI